MDHQLQFMMFPKSLTAGVTSTAKTPPTPPPSPGPCRPPPAPTPSPRSAPSSVQIFQILKNICSSVEPAAAHGHERRAGGAGEQSDLHPQLHGEVARGHQAVELGLGEGDTEHRGHSIYLSHLTMGIVQLSIHLSCHNILLFIYL